MRRLLQSIDRFVGIAANLLVGVASVVLMAIPLATTAYVILRQLKFEIFFVEEWSGYLLVLLGWFAAAYTLRTGGHIDVAFVYRHLTPRLKNATLSVASLISVLIMVYLVKKSIDWFIYGLLMGGVSTFPSHTPMWIPYLFVPVGAIVFTLALSVLFIRRFVATIAGSSEVDVTGPPDLDITM